DRRADVAEVNLPELVHFGEGAASFEYVLAHLLATFHPGPRAETDADVGTIGDLQSADVAIEVAEDASRHSAQFRHRRIVRVDANAHAQFFCNWHDLLNEKSVVFPKLFLAVLAAVSKRPFKNLAAPISFRILVHVESARRGSAAR